MTGYSLVESTTRTPANLSMSAKSLARKTWLCPGAGGRHVSIGTTSVDVYLAERIYGTAVLNAVFGTGVGLAHQNFLDVLGIDTVRENLYAGRVFGPDGRELPKWSTIRGKHEICVRGSDHVTWHKCEVCGRVLYHSYDPHYLSPEPEVHIQIFDYLGALWVMEQRLAERVVAAHLRGIRTQKLPVLPEPLDGLKEVRC